jgi:dinuclear metal center YbgI/SA1388 family protein
MPTIADVIGFLEQLIPLSIAAEWDNVGLILGERTAVVRSIMTCLTVTPEVVDEAVRAKVSLIVAHHPMLFRATKRLTDASNEGRMIHALIRSGVAVYSPHTAFDNCKGGINDQWATQLGLIEVSPLRPNTCPGRCKIVVFVPDKDLKRVSDALFNAGAGVIGNYSECSFRLLGTGTFLGGDASQPTIGERGRREEVAEWRLEVVCRESHVEKAVRAMRAAHSYEEPAFDIYPLRSDSGPGEGRVGRLPQPETLAHLADRIRTHLGSGMVQVVGDQSRQVSRIALACGAAGEFLGDAVRERADVFLTGEMRFHDYLAAKAHGIGLILPGHFASEFLGTRLLAEKLRDHFTDIVVSVSQSDTDPVAWV